MEVVIPTQNDVSSLDQIVTLLSSFSCIKKIHIVNNNSTAANTQIIQEIVESERKCVYHFCSSNGKGSAIKIALHYTSDDVLFLDADISNLSSSSIKKLIERFYNTESCDFVKANITRANGQSNSGFILSEFSRFFPNLSISRPTCGIYIVKKGVINGLDVSSLPDGWAIDIAILLEAHIKGNKIIEEDIGTIFDKARNETSLEQSEKQLSEYLRHFLNCHFPRCEAR